MFHLQYKSEYDLYFAKEQLHPLLPQIYPKLHLTYYADPSIPRCISYYEAFKGPEQPSDIYKAIDNVVSYMSFRRADRMKSATEFGTVSEFYLPIVVLDGKLFEASITLNAIEVNERQHIQLRTFHHKDIAGTGVGSQQPYVIDVVTRDHFAALLRMVEALHNKIVSAIRGLRLSADFTAKAWLQRKELIRSYQSGLIEMMKAEDARAKRRLRTLHKKESSKSKTRISLNRDNC